MKGGAEKVLGGAWLYASQYDPTLFIPGFATSNHWHVSKRWEEDALLGSRFRVSSPHIWSRKLDGQSDSHIGYDNTFGMVITESSLLSSSKVNQNSTK